MSAEADPFPDAGAPPHRVLVVGTGLVGTSVALALRHAGSEVHLVDRDESEARTAAELGAGTFGWPVDEPDLVVVGVPPAAVGAMVVELQALYAAAIVTDLASVKSVPLADVRAAGGDLVRYVGGHPLAGRERSGPRAARGDLFEGRPWVLTPSPECGPDALAVTRGLVLACGATPVTMTAEEHDDAVALVSHVPHLLAAAAAGRLAPASDEAVALAGQGVRDVTRVAASDPDLWVEILTANAVPVADALDLVRADLEAATRALRDGDADAVRALLAHGNDGRGRIPGKHGGTSVRYVVLPVLVPDRPGELGRLFAAVGEAGVNIEDVSIEHSPGQPVGLVELAVGPGEAATLVTALRADGWTVQD